MDGREASGHSMFTWLTGRAATTIAEPSQEHDDRPDDWPSTVPFRRRPRPLLRVIRWTPPDSQSGPVGSERPSASVPARSGDPAHGHDHDLFVRQRALREVRSQLMGSPEHESFGFLMGRLLYCPWTKTSFVLIDQAWQASGPLPSKEQTLAFREAWTSAWQAARRRRLQVIGWYHSHGVLGLQLSGRDMEIHRRYFPDPWQTALIVVPDGDQPLGGFIQRRSALFFAQSLVPFYEVLDADAVWRDDAKPSWVDWENYGTDEAIRIVAPSVKPARGPRRAETGDDTPPRDERPEIEAAPRVVELAPQAEPEPPSAEAEPARPEEVAESRPQTPETDEPPAADLGSQQELPRQAAMRSFEEEARDFARAARQTQHYDPREGSVSLPWPMLPDLGDVPWRHRGPFQKHLPLPTRHAPRRGRTSAPSLGRTTRPPSPERTKFMEVVRAPAPFTAESGELALEAWQTTSDPGLPPPDPTEATVALDPMAEAKASLLESGVPALEPVEGVEPLATPASLDALRRWVSAHTRAERITRERTGAERVDRRRSEAERVDRERAEAERLAKGPRVAETGAAAAPALSDDAAKRTQPFTIDGEPARSRAPDSARGEPAVEVPAAMAVPRTVAPAKPHVDDGDDRYEYTVPVVMPAGQRFPLLAGVRRRLGRIAAVILVVGAVATALELRGRGEPAPTTPYVAPPVSAELLDFSRSGDELGRQISAYETTRVQFEAGEIDCAGLAASQASVSQAFVTVADKYAVVGSRLPLRERLEYERLASSASQATSHFDAAGCAEPQ